MEIPFFRARIFCIFFNFFLFWALYSQPSFAGIPYEQLKDLNGPLTNEAQWLSPTYGVIYSETAIVENLGTVFLKPPLDKIVGLVFHRIDNLSFLPSHLFNNPAPYLGPGTLGKVAGRLFRLKVDLESQREKREGKGSVADVSTLKKTAKKDLLNILLDPQDPYRQMTEAKFIQDRENLLVQKKNFEKRIAQGQSFTPEEEKTRDFLQSKSDSLIPTSELKEKTKSWAKFLVEGAENPQTYKVLSALLWQKVKKKNEFLPYFEGIKTQYPLALASSLDASTWEARQYEPEDQERLFNEIRTGKDLSLEDWIFLYKKQQQQNSPLQRFGDAMVKGISFPDCGETSLRNVFKILLNRDGHYDTDLLRGMGEASGFLSPALLAFFKRFSTPESQESAEARHAWAEVVSNLNTSSTVPPAPLVEYNLIWDDLDCNLAGVGAGNILAVLNHLIGVKTWEDFERLIPEGDRKIQINPQLDSHGFGIIFISTSHEGHFAWNFGEAHFHLESIPVRSVLDDHRQVFVQHPHLQDLLALGPFDQDKMEFLVSAAGAARVGEFLLYGTYASADHILPLQLRLQSYPYLESLISEKGWKNLYNRLFLEKHRMMFVGNLPLDVLPMFKDHVQGWIDLDLNCQRMVDAIVTMPFWESHLQRLKTLASASEGKGKGEEEGEGGSGRYSPVLRVITIHFLKLVQELSRESSLSCPAGGP